MPHERIRAALQQFNKLKSFWPVIGILGPRQVGKTTFLSNQISTTNVFTMDDNDIREEANLSAKIFLSKLPNPVVIDEIQKAPDLFDAIKSKVDKKRVPGQYFITGSTQFSEKVGIRESLTGRMGLLHLYPLNLRESLGNHLKKSKPSLEEFAKMSMVGGMPVPAFLRDINQRKMYWNSWLETTIYRDLQKVMRKNYDPDFSLKIIHKMAKILSEGEYPTIPNLNLNTRKAKRYIEAMLEIFLLRKIPCHEIGVGHDHYIFMDSGLFHHLAEYKQSEGISYGLTRHYLINEILCHYEYSGKPLHLEYYKSARGSVIDLVIDDTLIKITNTLKQRGWEEKTLIGAMKTLKFPKSYLCAPTTMEQIVKKGVGTLAWTHWS